VRQLVPLHFPACGPKRRISSIRGPIRSPRHCRWPKLEDHVFGPAPRLRLNSFTARRKPGEPPAFLQGPRCPQSRPSSRKTLSSLTVRAGAPLCVQGLWHPFEGAIPKILELNALNPYRPSHRPRGESLAKYQVRPLHDRVVRATHRAEEKSEGAASSFPIRQG